MTFGIEADRRCPLRVPLCVAQRRLGVEHRSVSSSKHAACRGSGPGDATQGGGCGLLERDVRLRVASMQIVRPAVRRASSSRMRTDSAACRIMDVLMADHTSCSQGRRPSTSTPACSRRGRTEKLGSWWIVSWSSRAHHGLLKISTYPNEERPARAAGAERRDLYNEPAHHLRHRGQRAARVTAPTVAGRRAPAAALRHRCTWWSASVHAVARVPAPANSERGSALRVRSGPLRSLGPLNRETGFYTDLSDCHAHAGN